MKMVVVSIKKIILSGLIAGILAGLLIGNVRAHDHARPEMNGWLKGLSSTKAGPCCDGNDKDDLADSQWESRDGHYWVFIESKWIPVEDSAVIKEPNLDGRTMVWIYHQNGEPVVRCFMPGAMI